MKNRFQRQGFIVLMVCSAIMLGIGIFMYLSNIDSSSIVTSRYGDPLRELSHGKRQFSEPWFY